jgi:hypothetical protein
MTSPRDANVVIDRRREGFAEGSRPIRRWLCVHGVLIELPAEEARS